MDKFGKEISGRSAGEGLLKLSKIMEVLGKGFVYPTVDTPYENELNYLQQVAIKAGLAFKYQIPLSTDTGEQIFITEDNYRLLNEKLEAQKNFAISQG